MPVKTMVRVAFALMLALAGANAARAQEGTVPADCTKLESQVLPVSICLDPRGWALADIGSAAEMEFSTTDQQLFMMVITETEYFDLETLRKAVLTNAQLAAGLDRIEIVTDEEVPLADREFGHLVYKAKVDDINASYENYYIGLEGQGSVQFVLFTVDQPIEPLADLIADVVASIEIVGNAQ